MIQGGLEGKGKEKVEEMLQYMYNVSGPCQATGGRTGTGRALPEPICGSLRGAERLSL